MERADVGAMKKQQTAFHMRGGLRLKIAQGGVVVVVEHESEKDQ